MVKKTTVKKDKVIKNKSVTVKIKKSLASVDYHDEFYESKNWL